MRDLKADLELCNKATPGPWKEQGTSVQEWCIVSESTGDTVVGADYRDGPWVCITAEDSDFVIEAREGWPHAIERALELEEELTRCGNTLVELTIALKDDRKRAGKAETLARELVEALEVAFELLEDHQPNWYLRMHFNQINNALGSYKEVLGDGN